MENEFNTQERAMTPGSKDNYSDTILAHALLISAGARDELTQAKAVRAEAEKRREEAEAEAARVLDELFAEANLRAQKLIEGARAVKMEAEADRARAREEMEDATTARIEAETRCQQIEAEARENAEKIVQEALQQADIKAAELKRRAEEEVRKLLVDAASIHATAQEEMETQRVLADAARIQARTAHLQVWANSRSAPQPHSTDHGPSGIHEPTQAEPGEAVPIEDTEPHPMHAPTYGNDHKDSENGLVKTEHRRSHKKS